MVQYSTVQYMRGSAAGGPPHASGSPAAQRLIPEPIIPATRLFSLFFVPLVFYMLSCASEDPEVEGGDKF